MQKHNSVNNKSIWMQGINIRNDYKIYVERGSGMASSRWCFYTW